MGKLPEFVGTIHIFLGPHRGNPIGLYLRQEGESCKISPTIYPWNQFIGVGETVNKAAADFDLRWKEGNLAPDMYSGPHWEAGIKPEKPKPPPKPAEARPAEAETSKPVVPAKPWPQAADLAQNVPVNPNPLSSATEAEASPPQPSVSSEPASTTKPVPSGQPTDKPAT